MLIGEGCDGDEMRGGEVLGRCCVEWEGYLYLLWTVVSFTWLWYVSYHPQTFVLHIPQPNHISWDPLTNILFWVDCGGSLIRWMDVTNPSLTGNFSTAPSVPYRITAFNDTFYWTVHSDGGGAVYKVDQPRSGLSQAPANIWTSSTIIPYAVRVSVDGFSCERDVIVVHHVDMCIHHVDMCIHHIDMCIHHIDMCIHHVDMCIHHVDMCIHHVDMCIHHVDMCIHHVDMRIHHVDMCIHHVDMRIHHVDMRIHHVDMRIHRADMCIHHVDVCAYITNVLICVPPSSPPLLSFPSLLLPLPHPQVHKVDVLSEMVGVAPCA